MIRLELSYRGLLLLIMAPLLFWLAVQLWSIILLILLALILTIGLLPAVEGLVRRGLSRGGAVLLTMGLILATLILLFSVMVPPLVDETKAVKDNLPDSARELEEILAMLGIQVELQERAKDIDWAGLVSGRVAIDYGQRLISVALSLITVLVMTAYLLADLPRLGRFLRQFMSESSRGEGERVFEGLTRVVGGYLRGQLITSLIIGVFVFVLLRIVGVANPLAFAVLAAFADVIPLIGALIAIVPPVATALQDSSTKALIVLGALMAYQQFEDRVLVPRVYGQTLNLPPIVVLIAVLAGAELLGIVGVLLALPFAAAGRVALDFTIEHRRLPLTGQGNSASVDTEAEKSPV